MFVDLPATVFSVLVRLHTLQIPYYWNKMVKNFHQILHSDVALEGSPFHVVLCSRCTTLLEKVW